MFCESKACLQKNVSKKWLGPWEGMVGRRPCYSFVIFERVFPFYSKLGVDQSTKSTNQSTSDSLARKKTWPRKNSTNLLAFFQWVPSTFSTASGGKKTAEPLSFSPNLLIWEFGIQSHLHLDPGRTASCWNRAVGIRMTHSEIIDEKHIVPISS